MPINKNHEVKNKVNFPFNNIIAKSCIKPLMAKVIISDKAFGNVDLSGLKINFPR